MSDLQRNIKNFGTIKSIFNNLLTESVLDKDLKKKKLFKEYVNGVRKNAILKAQFEVYTNLASKAEPDIYKATQYVKESIDLFSKYTKKEIYEANLTLAEKILFEQEGPIDDLAELNENIATLIFTEKTPATIDTIVEATSKVVNYIINNKPKVLPEGYDVPTSVLASLMVEKYNTKYSELDETEKKILKTLIDANDEEKQNVYKSTLRECIDLINEKLNTSDLEVKDKLLKVKDKLLNDKHEVNEDFITNVSKLIELRTSLK